MHKLLSLQLKKCLGEGWESRSHSPEVQKFIDLVEQTYGQYDDDYRILEHTLDVSSRELSEALQEAKQQHDLLRSVTESASDLIFYKDLQFRYIGCNKRCADFFGIEQKNFIGKDDFELFSEEVAALFREMDKRMIDALAPRTNTEWVLNAKGEMVLLLTTKAPLVNAQGEFLGLVGIARDITKEQQMENEIRSQQAMLIQQSRFAAMGEMIGNIAHQWRQPLNTLGLIVQDIEEAYRYGELDEAYIQKTRTRAMEQINYMSRTIDDFRNFFAPNRDKKFFSLRECVEDTLNILESGLQRQNIRLELNLDGLQKLYGYRNEFAQVLFNLIKNAKDALVEHNVDKPTIWIEGKYSGGNVEIRISDNAGGIPDAIREKIFDPYFTTKEEGKGTGIGLYMSKMIIEGHMDGILRSEETPAGASFVIMLPDLKEEKRGDDE